MIIGVTGGTGCGKTTFLQTAQVLGGTVLDCDQIYHQLLQSDNALLLSIEKAFPGVVKDNVLDRKALGAVVFSDPEALNLLNSITHSAVKAAVTQQLCAVKNFAVIDAIALFESGLASLCDTTVAITAPENVRVQRLIVRDGIDEAYAAARIAAQRPQAEFVQLCDHHLVNDGTADQFREKCLAFLRSIGII